MMFCLLVLGESPHCIKTAVTSAAVTFAFASMVAASSSALRLSSCATSPRPGGPGLDASPTRTA
eukprot:7477442-Prorocentrum_lima.AAC.1